MSENPIRCNFPLRWPEGWKRTQSPRRSAFDRERTMVQAREFVLRELRLMGAHSVTVSSNIAVRPDGLPRSGQSQPSDRGVAVYFKRSGVEYALACDRWLRVEDNLYAIGCHISALRGQERWGVGSPEQAIQGYQRLLPPAAGSSAPWWVVLGVPAMATAEEIRAAYIALARFAHPDVGGSTQEMTRLVIARDQGLQASAGVREVAR